MRTAAGETVAEVPAETGAVIRIRASGICFTDVHQTNRLDEAPRAYERVAAGKARFRAVISVP